MKTYTDGNVRLRLREEVDILRHLAQAAVTDPKGHANVLAYIDSWEQDDTLFIQTELCEWGNFARFLWEYGRAFRRLDEARVWKIFVELSNVRRYDTREVFFLLILPSRVFGSSTKQASFISILSRRTYS